MEWEEQGVRTEEEEENEGEGEEDEGEEGGGGGVVMSLRKLYRYGGSVVRQSLTESGYDEKDELGSLP